MTQLKEADNFQDVIGSGLPATADEEATAADGPGSAAGRAAVAAAAAALTE